MKEAPVPANAVPSAAPRGPVPATVYVRLFAELFRIALFVIGGGYAILAVADQVFAKRKWTEEGELLDQLPVFQMVPGIIATHTAVYVGRKMAGIAGAAVGVVAVALPSVAIFTAVSMGYASLPLDDPRLLSAFVGLRAALTGIVAATVARSWRKAKKDGLFCAVLAASLAALFAGAPVWAVLVAAMAVGLAAAFAPRRPATAKARRFRSFAWLPILCFLKYGVLCFGGGFVLVPMYIEDFVGAAAPWLQISPAEFSNLMALTQMTPGPIGVNGATFFGFRLGGIPGALLASAALLLPGSALVYMALASLDRFRSSRVVRGILLGTRPASFALMASALWSFLGMSVFADGAFSPAALAFVAACLVATMRRWVNPVLLIVLSALLACAVRA